MQTASPSQPTLEQQLIAVVQSLPEDRAREVLDFALFVQARIAADEGAWDELFAGKADQVTAWVDRIMAEEGALTGVDTSGDVLKPASPQ